MILLSGLILAGAKLLYLLETVLCPYDDYVPLAYRGVAHGFRIPGGILLLAALGPFLLRGVGLPWKRFGDETIVVVPVMAVLVRLGCVLNGCCFGRLSEQPIALRFPRESWAHWFHASSGWIPRDAPMSLSVHPLQLYFVVASLATLVLLIAIKRLDPLPGVRQTLFYAAFFSSTAFLEPIRANFLTLNNLLAPAAAIVFSFMAFAMIFQRRAAWVATGGRK